MANYHRLLGDSAEIVFKAIEDYKPYAIVAMFSGGTDSLAALKAAQWAGINIDALVHINTRTGIQETTDFVRTFAARQGLRYLEGDAGSAYQDYVRRKGFIGKGTSAHAIAYHILKATPIRQLISRNFRQGKRGRNVLLLNGVRQEESDNRKRQYSGAYYDIDSGAKSNIWVNLIWDWSKVDCFELIKDYALPRNPVAKALHRSGECMCGTMQDDTDRVMAAGFYPLWGMKMHYLEQEVMSAHPWGWGENQPTWIDKIKKGQMGMGDDYFMPMCRTCQLPEAA